VPKLKLPPNPKGIRVLQSWESDRLKLLFPNPDKLPPTYKECITCGGTKEFKWFDFENMKNDFVPIADYECDCIGQWVLHRYFLYNGIGTELQRLGWPACIVVGEPRRIVQQYVQEDNIGWNMDQGIGLYLYGPNGTGKSLMASILLRRTLASGYSGHWTSFHEMRSAKTNTWKDEGRSEWFNRKILATSVLVIDDPGQEGKTEKSLEYSRTILDEVIRHRMQASLVTIITSNQTPENFRLLYGGAVDSLIQERMIPVSVPGEDYRPNMRPDKERDRKLGLTRPIVIA
jgi:hypothetical protein